MENILIYDKITAERKQLKHQIQDSTARFSDASLRIWEQAGYGSVCVFVDQEHPLQMAVVEISNDSEIALSKKLRTIKADLEMMLVADSSISPMEYLTPDVRAASLLLRPCTDGQLEQVVRSFIAAYFRDQQSGPDSGIVIEKRDGMTVIPFRSICYLEAREKKVFIRQQDREHGIYDTLDGISDRLPDWFMKCHRSFIVNTRYIERVKLSENTIYLENGITVPLSRSYKAEIKELMNGR